MSNTGAGSIGFMIQQNIPDEKLAVPGTSVEIAARIQAVVSSGDLQQWYQGTPAHWALESRAIVRAQVFEFRDPARSAKFY